MAKPVRKKEPLSIDNIKAFVHNYAGVNCLLSDLRIATLVLLSFAGFLRINEVLNLRRSDIKFYASYCIIFIRSSKTDVYRLGDNLVITRTGSLCCLVQLLERYLKAANITDSDSDEYIFRAVMSETASKSQT